MGKSSPRKKRQNSRRRTLSNASNDNISPEALSPTFDLKFDTFSNTFPQKSLPFITTENDSTQLIINPIVTQLLEQITYPIILIAIAGLYRTGKSSLLNWLLNRHKGFSVASTIEPCTKGIWIYACPLIWTLSNRQKTAIFFIDTEGLGGLNASQEYDARIFSLATLLSSKLIFNSQGSIDEKAIQNVSFIANLANHIRLHASNSESESDSRTQLHAYFPSFLWVLRDFTLELVDEDGESITAREYLELALTEQSARTPLHAERNRVRNMLKEFYRDRDCVTLVRPVLQESELEGNATLSVDQLRIEFQAQLKELKTLIFDEKTLQPKRVHDRILNGAMYIALVQAFVDAVNHGGVPVISSAWQCVTEKECRDALQSAIAMYESAIVELSLPIEAEELTQALNEMEKRALESYQKRAIGEFSENLSRDLIAHMDQKRASLIRQNYSDSECFCEARLNSLYMEMVQPFLSEYVQAQKDTEDVGGYGADLDHFGEIYAAFREAYLTQAKGSAKLECFVSFSDVKYAEAMRILMTKQEDCYEKKIRYLELDVSKVKEELGSTGGRERVYQEELEKMHVQSLDVVSEKARLEAENEEQKTHILNLQAQILSNMDESESAKEIAAVDLKFQSAENDQLAEMKAEFERLKKEKEEQLKKMKELIEENENLRRVKTCLCVIS